MSLHVSTNGSTGTLSPLCPHIAPHSKLPPPDECLIVLIVFPCFIIQTMRTVTPLSYHTNTFLHLYACCVQCIIEIQGAKDKGGVTLRSERKAEFVLTPRLVRDHLVSTSPSLSHTHARAHTQYISKNTYIHSTEPATSGTHTDTHMRLTL